MKKSFFDRFSEKLGFRVMKTGSEVEVVDLKKIRVWRLVMRYFSFLLLFWGLYRLLIRLPENIEELFLKPLIWLGSLFWVVRKIEKKPLSSLGLSFKGGLKSIYWGLGFGFVFALEGFLANLVKYGGLSLPDVSYQGMFLAAFLISVVTGFCEELVFRGFIFNRLAEVMKKEWQVNLVTSILFVLMHLPVAIFVLRYDLLQMSTYILILSMYSAGAGFLFGRTKTIVAPTLLHIFWSWPIILFR